MINNYPYAHGELLETPHSYQYSRYGGLEFLKSWHHNRSEVILTLPPPLPPPAPMRKYKPVSASFHLNDRLEELMDGLIQEQMNDNAFVCELALWVKKFEVTKRLFAEYDSRFRPLFKHQYHNLDVYVRYAEIMESAYCKSKKLFYLNVILKVIDTLISCRNKLGKVEKSRLAWLIQREINHIKSLAKTHGLKI